jgi:hypothetical protein
MDMIENYRGVAQHRKQVREGVSRIVNESAEMDFIRQALEDKGLDPILAKLIAEFGALMYTRGHRSSLPSSSTR